MWGQAAMATSIGAGFTGSMTRNCAGSPARTNPHPTLLGTPQHLAALRMLFDWLVVGQVLGEAPKSVGSNGETVLRLKGERAFEVDVWTFNRRCRLL